MKERVLVKKNVFTCVMFGAIFLFILCESIFKSDMMSMIAFIIAIPIFILSIIKLVVDVLEDLNDKITSYLSSEENGRIPSWEDFDRVRETEEKDIDNVAKEIANKHSEYPFVEREIKQYFYARKTRETIRKFRRFMLYIYYLVFMIIMVLLLLHTELYALIESNGWFNGINMDLFEVWSLIIILLEIMMKDIIEDIITYVIDKSLGLSLEYY